MDSIMLRLLPLLRRTAGASTRTTLAHLSRSLQAIGKLAVVALITLGLLATTAQAAPHSSDAAPRVESASPGAAPALSAVPVVQLPPGTINIALLGVDKR